ncbi:dual specificity protein phosphatase 13-like, partial [Clarias magur]
MVDSPQSTKEHSISSLHDSPTVEQLEEILHGGQLSCNHVDEVWPRLFLGDMFMSHNRYGLWRLGITHVLNAAHGKMCCKGSDDFYGTTVQYYGVPANDLPTFDISPFFYPSAQYIHQALNTTGALNRSTHRATDMTAQKHKQRLAEIRALENILDGCKFDLSAVDEVWPNVYIGNVAIAQNRSALKKLGITHILNAAHAKQGSLGDESYYGTAFVYYGIPAEDSGRLSLKELSAYETPSVAELQDFLLADRHPTGHVNQVWPNVYIGNEVAARDKPTLYSMGITHIVNAASGPPHVNTGPRFYRDMAVDYYGVEADDSTDFLISVFFYPTARFIRAALSNE